MRDVLAIAMKSMQIDQALLEKASMNMVNSSTPGYRRESAAVQSFGELIEAEQSDVVQMKIQPDFSQGSLSKTARTLDLAIQGRGFFELKGEDGSVYTRRGHFYLNASGKLVGDNGMPVITDQGEITLRSDNIRLERNGEIFDLDSQTPDQAIARIKLAYFDKSSDLKRVEGGFQENSPGKVISDYQSQISQGYLENSNVNTTQEMIQVMKTLRHFESVQRVAQGYDEMLGTAIRKLGEV